MLARPSDGLGTMLREEYLGDVNIEVIGLGEGDSREESDTDSKLGLHLGGGNYVGWQV